MKRLHTIPLAIALACFATPVSGDEQSEAVEAYLAEVAAIEQQAAAAKEAARRRLLEQLRGKQPKTKMNGLIGTAKIADEQTYVAYHYKHGRLWNHELIRKRFHRTGSDGNLQVPSVVIEMVGYVDVPKNMTVKIWQSAGGVSADHGELFVGDRRLGITGDDTHKQVIYMVDLPMGRHPIRWVLTGGMFQNNLLKFEDPNSGKTLNVYHTDKQRRDTQAAEATATVIADADPGEWLKSIRSWNTKTVAQRGD